MKITVENFSDELATFLINNEKKYDGLDNALLACAEVGASVLTRVQMSKDMDFVRAESERIISLINKSVTEQSVKFDKIMQDIFDRGFDVNSDSSYSKRFAEHLNNIFKGFRDEISNDIKTVRSESKAIVDISKGVSNERLKNVEEGIKNVEEKFNPDLETSYLGKVKSVIKNTEEKLHKQFDMNNKESFATKLMTEAEKYFGEDAEILNKINKMLGEYHYNIQRDIIALREAIAKKEGIDELSEVASEKGFEFEKVLFEKLQEIAKPFNDIVEETGTITDASGKKGDFMYTLATGEKFLIEAKDTKVVLKSSLDYLNEAMKNRSVPFSLMVTEHIEQLPKQVGLFGVYEDNKVITSMHYLEIAVKWCRMLLRKASLEKTEDVNVTAISNEIQSVVAQLKNIANIRRKLTSLNSFVEKNTGEIRTIADALKEEIEKSIEIINKELLKKE